jgi:hypothetical protein
VSVMARALMENALTPAMLDELFEEKAKEQYTRELLFSALVGIMSVVVCRIKPSVHAAYQQLRDRLSVSVTSVYNKINGLEPSVAGAFVSHTAGRLGDVVREMGGQMPELIPGYRVRILDGNHFASTERRLGVLRQCWAGPLPGHALVVLDSALMLVTHMIPCEDGHAQERSLSDEILNLVNANDIWVADRNFCTIRLLRGIATRYGLFAIRHHANMQIVPTEPLHYCGRIDTGEVYEQNVDITESGVVIMNVRRIIIRLDKPTRDGETEISILTNIPSNVADAIAIANLYRKRWTLETVFQSLTQMLDGEIETLGYPRAALFVFATALVSYNIMSTIQAAMRSAFGVECVKEKVSSYYIATEVCEVFGGMSIAVEPAMWTPFQTMTPALLAEKLLDYAKNIRLASFKRHPRGPKKPVPPRTRHTDTPHVSTARLLIAAKGRTTP